MSQSRKLMIMLAAFIAAAAGLGLYAYFGVMKPSEVETEQKQTKEKLFSAYPAGEKSSDGGAMPAPVFYSLTVKAKGETTVLEKKDGQWLITAPIQTAADSSAVDQLANAITSSKVKETVEENPTDADLEKYGLKEAKFAITGYAFVPDKDGKGQDDPSRRREISLNGGIENTFNGSAYVRKKGDKTVYSVDGWIRNSLEKTTFDLRKKDVFALDEAKLKKIEFKSKSNQYSLDHDESNNWRLTKPVATAADTATVSGMISSFKGQKALSFPADTPELRKKLKLDAPLIDVVFGLDGNDRIRVRLAKQKAESDAEKTYALREQAGETTLAEVPDAAAKDLDKNPKDLRDKTVLTFKKEDVAKITFGHPGPSQIAVERVITDGGAEDWRVVAPEPGPAKKWKISSLLYSLSSLKATALGDEHPKDWNRYGLGKAQKVVTVFGNDGKILAKLEVGKDVAGKQNTVYARGIKDQALELESNRLSELPTTVADVLDNPPPASDAGTAALKN